MKYIDKLKQDHPDCVGEYFTGGARGCPYDYGYEKNPPCVAPGQLGTLSCRACWKREMPSAKNEA